MNASTQATPGTKRKAAHYHSKIAGAHSEQQNIKVLQYLRDIGQPTNVRVLCKIINGRGYEIDLVSTRRCITNLSKPNPKGIWLNQWGRAMVREAFEKPCPITNVTVGWYEIIPTRPHQTDLFQ